jgi:hypothetical protein
MREPAEAAVSPGWRKSSYSNGGAANCVQVGALPWRKSSFSNGGAQTCVEAAHVPGAVLVRDTTQHGHGPVLRVSAETWRAFTTRIRTTA